MQSHDVEYHSADGTRYVGYIARPASPTGPAVLIAHNAPGVSDFERGVAGKLAEAGYVVLCADYIGNGDVLGMEALGARMAPLIEDPSLIREPMQAALATLVAEPGVDPSRVAAIGYCFGGAAALELARSGADVAAVVGFHSSLPVNRPEDARAIRGKILIQQGAADPLVSPDVRTLFEAQMNAAGVDWQMHLFGGTKHAFTVPGSEAMGMPGIAYHASSDRRSWRAMMELFAESIDRVTAQAD